MVVRETATGGLTMDPHAPLTVGQFYGAVLGIILERRDARRFGRRMEEDRRRCARPR